MTPGSCGRTFPCFDEDLERIFDVGQRTVQKRRRAGLFPSLSFHRSTSGTDTAGVTLIAFLERECGGRVAAFRRKSA